MKPNKIPKGCEDPQRRQPEFDPLAEEPQCGGDVGVLKIEIAIRVGMVPVQSEAPTSAPATFELSPEQLDTMATLKARYEANANRIICHNSTPWAKVEAKLRSNPAKLATLKQMEDTGGAPDVYKIEGSDFIFGDLSEAAPRGRRNLSWSQAAGEAGQMGAELMSEQDYLLLGNEFNIVMDAFPEWSWLAGPGLSGNCYNGYTRVYRYGESSPSDNGAFRCSLRV